MTGKELKEFASTVPDDAVVAVRERGYGAYEPRFEMQAVLTFVTAKKEEESANV